jgi:hypothetical protein
MLIVPGLPPLQQTSNSRELGRRVEQVIRDYQREHPEMTEAEVRAALLHSTPGDAPEVVRRRKLLGIAIGAFTAAAFGAMAATGGGARSIGGTGVWQIIGAVAVVCAVVFVLIRLARRD